MVLLTTPLKLQYFGKEKTQKAIHRSNLMHVVSVFHKLCSALTPNQETGTNSAPLTPELRSTYVNQLRQLHESGVLTDSEFEEQRINLTTP